jgi:hypothetical protein
MRQNLYAILLVTLLQLLWVAAESNGWESPGQWHRRALKISVGFPVRCASYTAIHTTGDLPAWTNYPERSQWLPGLRVSRVLWPLDALAAVAAFFGFRWLLRFEAGRAASMGFVLGLVAGVLDSFSTIASWRPISVWVIAPLMLVGLPVTVCFLTRRARSVWLPLLMLAVAVLVMPWMASRLEHFRADHGFSFAAGDSSVWSPSVTEMVFMPLVCIAVLSIPVLLIRRFLPVFWKHEAVA